MAKKPAKVTWFEIPADDTARASKFYQKLFDWTMSEMGGGSLAIQTGPSDESLTPLERGSINGDISPRNKDFDMPLIVVTVEDMEETLSMVKSAGGEIILPSQEIPGMGIIWAIIKDTEGNKVGITQNL